MILYHITEIKNIENILVNGLLINSKNNGFVSRDGIKEYYKKYGLQPIFLTNDVDYIIKTQLTESFFKKCKILSIDVTGLDLEDEYNYLEEKWNLYYNCNEDMYINILDRKGKSFICKENIKPDRIIIKDIERG
jgi:hypothetical protein